MARTVRRTVLIVAPDATRRAALAKTLRAAGYGVELAEGEKRAREVAAAGQVNLAIIAADFGEPTELARELRDRIGRVVVVTRPNAQPGRPATAPAVFYVSNPQGEQELLDKVRLALAPAFEEEPPSYVLRFAGYTLDLDGRALFDPSGRIVPLTPTEFSLLLELVRHPRRVRSREQLRNAISGQELEIYERSIDMHISRLRHKIEPDARKPRYIATVPGAGYKFTAAIQRTEATNPPAEAAPPLRQSPGQRPFERRELTVLSCAFKGLAALALDRDPEELQQTSGELRRICGEVVGRYGGAVASFLGDAMVAAFGYPEAHEDDCERAIRAAIDIIEATAARSPALPPGLHPRIGIAARPAIIGDPGGGENRIYEVIGATPYLANRLAAAAADGIIVEENVRRAAGRIFAYRKLAPVCIEGAAEPVPVWRVLGTAPYAGRFSNRREAGLTRFVGRAEEIESLRQRWAQVRDGIGEVVLLAGEPGIGKSRLVHELQRAIEAEDYVRLRFFGSPHHAHTPLFPVLRHLERAAGFAPGDSPEQKIAKLRALHGGSDSELQRDLPLLAALLSVRHHDDQPVRGMSPQQRKRRTFALLHDMVGRLAATRPILAIFEDAHWLDSLSLELLASAVDWCERLPMLLLVTARPEFEPPWPAHPHVRRLMLSRLASKDGATLVKSVAGGNKLTPTTVRHIVDNGDGVPLFLEELAKDALRRAAAGEAAPAGRNRVPATLEGLLLESMNRLDENSKNLAQTGAAIGRIFTYELLRQLHPSEALDAGLRQIVEARIVFRRGVPPDASYEFRHALVRDAAYGTLSANRRQALHRRIAAALEAGFPEIVETQPELLAHHHAEAGDAAKAVNYHLVAAERALLRSATAEAQQHIEACLQLLNTLPEDEERHRREVVAQVFAHRLGVMTRGRTAPEVFRALRRAHDLCQGLKDQQYLPPVLFGLWYATWSAAAYSEAAAHAQELLIWANRHQDNTASTFARYGLGLCQLNSGSLREARLHLDAAHALDRFDGAAGWPVANYWADGIVRVSSFLQLRICLLLLGRIGEADKAAREAKAAEQTMSQTYARGLALLLRCRDYSLQRDHLRLHETASDLLELSGAQGYPDINAHAAAYRGWAMAMGEQAREGARLVEAAVERCRELGYLCWQSQLLILLAECHWRAGRPEGALRTLCEAEQVIGNTGEQLLAAELLRLRGEIHLDPLGEPEAAEQLFKDACEMAHRQEARLLELRANASLAHLWREQGRNGDARNLLRPLLERLKGDFKLPDLDRAQALMAAV